LNRGRHLYSTGRPSRWALAYVSSFDFYLNSLISKGTEMAQVTP